MTILAAVLSDHLSEADCDVTDDELREHAGSLLSDFITTYVAGDELTETLHPVLSDSLPKLSEISFALCNVVSNPALRKEKSEDGETGSFETSSASQFPPAPPQGKSKTLPPWCAKYLRRKPSQHEARLIEEIKGGAQKLGQHRGGVAVSRDVDFGIQRAAPHTSPEQDAYGERRFEGSSSTRH